MAEALAKKKRIRGGHRASATRMVQLVSEMIAAFVHDPTSELNTRRLLQLKMSLGEKLGTLKRLDEEILDLVEEDDVADEIEQADAFKEKIYAATVDIDRYCVPSSKGSPPPVDDGGASGSGRTRGAPHGARVKLPKLAIRPFNGDITNWTTFWDSFESAIDSSPGLTDIDKFNYLKSLLEKSAAEAISGLTLTADNYRDAVSILKKRFGNKQQIVSKHMDILLNLEAVSSQHNLKGLRRLYDVVESQVRGLKSLGVDSSSYGSLLSSVLLQKIPPELRLVLSREIAEGDWNLDALLKKLEREIEARERAMTSSTQSARKPGTDSSAGTAATFLTPTSAPSCCYCHQAHLSGNCRAVQDVGERKQILLRSGRCFVCLKRYHISRDCRSAVKCRKCGGRHHASICLKGISGGEPSVATPRTSEANQGTVTRQTDLNPQAVEYSPPTTNSMYTSAGMAVLLQTARVQVCNLDNPQSPMEVRVILDGGSQRSYITHRIRDALSLPAECKQRMSIKTFGSERGEVQDCEVVRVGMKTVDGNVLELPLLAVPLICEPLANQPIAYCQAEYHHLAQLELADVCEKGGDMPIDVLIGSDHYWKLVTGKVVKGKRGPAAVYTKLGWVLSGPADIPDQHVSSVNIVPSHTLRVDSHPQAEEGLDATLKMFWELESLGIGDGDVSALEDFDKGIVFKDGWYQVALPWKESHPVLPDNYQLSKKRLQGLLHRLRQQPSLLKEFDTTIKGQLSNGIVEKVNESECQPIGETHYIPHHAVIRQDKQTTKLHVVYDASAKAGGPSLNECLYTGPKFGQNIMDIILRFRVHNVALTADIEKAFLMVSVSEEDREILRFLWDPGSDGEVRGACVRVHSSGDRVTLLRRPVQLLYPLEVRYRDDSNGSDVPSTRVTDGLSVRQTERVHQNGTGTDNDPEMETSGVPECPQAILTSCSSKCKRTYQDSDHGLITVECDSYILNNIIL